MRVKELKLCEKKKIPILYFIRGGETFVLLSDVALIRASDNTVDIGGKKSRGERERNVEEEIARSRWSRRKKGSEEEARRM